MISIIFDIIGLVLGVMMVLVLFCIGVVGLLLSYNYVAEENGWSKIIIHLQGKDDKKGR